MQYIHLIISFYLQPSPYSLFTPNSSDKLENLKKQQVTVAYNK